jgi:hypothetical protein
MKIEIDIPDWAQDDRTIYIMSGIELVAFKRPGRSKTQDVANAEYAAQD